MKMFRWSVRLDEKTVVVVAEDKLRASKEGARALGVVWSKVAAMMEVRKLGRADG